MLDEVRLTNEQFRGITKIFVVACGSSYHAGLMAKYAIEHWARLPVEIDIASEFRYRNPVVDRHTLVVGVSQSGETTDTMQAVNEAKALGAKVLVISNVVDSSLARDADAVLYTRAGPEIGVAATKTHLAQITALEILALTWPRSARRCPRPRPAGCSAPWDPSRTRSPRPSTAWTTCRPWPNATGTPRPSSSSAATSAIRWRWRVRSS